MARERDPARDQAFEIYQKHKGDILIKDIAAELGKGEGTVRGWKNKDNWDGHLNGAFQSNERNAPMKNVERSKKKSAVESVPHEIKRVVEAFEEVTEENSELNDAQRLFCFYYVKYLNATKAYMKAYESTNETAQASGSRLLKNVKVRNEIARLKRERAAGIMLDGNDVLQKYIDIAFADLGDYVEYGHEIEEMRDFEGNVMLDKDGYPRTYKRSFVNFKQGADLDNSILSEVKIGKDGASLKLHDKMKALDVLAKYTDLLDDRTKTQLQNEKTKVDLIRAELDKHQRTDEHALKIEQARLNIEKTKLDIETAKKDEVDKEITINFVRKGDA